MLNKLLHEREYEILSLMSKNYTNKKIAKEINISVHTVKAHNTNIYKKLNAKTRTEAVVKAIKLGYLKLV